MKRLVVFVMALMLFLPLTGVSYAEDVRFVEISPVLLTSFDYTVAEWTSDEIYRSILVGCAIFDLIASEDDEILHIAAEALANNTIYVGREASALLVTLLGDEAEVYLEFNPSIEYVSSGIIQMPNALAVHVLEDAVDEDFLKALYQVDRKDALAVLTEIVELLED